MIMLFKNLSLRLWQQKGHLFVSLGMIFASILFALFMSQQKPATLRLAVVGEAPAAWRQSEKLQVTQLEKQPPKSSLTMGDYDAVVTFHQNQPEVQTVKNAKNQRQLTQLLTGKGTNKPLLTGTTSKGQKILGYVLMFVLMSAVSRAFLYSEDKEKHLMERIACSPMPQGRLFASYSSLIFLWLFLPTFLMLAVLHLVFNADLDLSLGNYAFLLLLLCLVSTSFSLCNASLFKDGDQATMIGGMIVMLTTLVSGSFFSLPSDNQLWSDLVDYLPQKQFLKIVETITTEGNYRTSLRPISYLLGLTVFFFVFAFWKNRQEYHQRG